jgi:transcriptional regulator with XRE-family HTH domain
MSANYLRSVMEANQKTEINVASDTGLAPNTVAKYLKGGAVNRSTETLLEKWAKEHSKINDGLGAA